MSGGEARNGGTPGGTTRGGAGDPFGSDRGPAGEPASAAADRERHAPDPHVLYRRFADASARAALDADAPILLVRSSGVVVVPLAADGAAGSDTPGGSGATPGTAFSRSAGATADAPGSELYRFPTLAETGVLADAAPAATAIMQIATHVGRPVYAASIRGDRPGWLPDHLEEVGYRALYGTIGDEELGLVGRAIQIVDWDETTRFCPRCGERTEAPEEECVKRCPSCDLTQYPRLAPAMIVGVVRDGKLLLGQSPRFRGQFHSILAGFVEPGETAEECVRREVYEEVGISVRNIRYFASQPWPFPHSFMLGFTAEYDSGELAPDPAEIVHADWYAADELPNVPGEVSISGRIINWFRRTYG